LIQAKNKKIKLNKNFRPAPQSAEEMYGGFLQFNISAIIEDIASKKLIAEKKRIYLKKWFKTHPIEFSKVDEEYLPLVNLNTPVIQAEIKIEKYEIIDGNHRMRKAYDDGRTYINSYKISGEQLANYLTSKKRYESYVRYWNDKVDSHMRGEL